MLQDVEIHGACDAQSCRERMGQVQRPVRLHDLRNLCRAKRSLHRRPVRPIVGSSVPPNTPDWFHSFEAKSIRLLTGHRLDGTQGTMKRNPTSATHSVAGELVQRLKRRRMDLGASVAQVAGWSGIREARLAELEKSGKGLSSFEFEHWCRGLAVAPGAFWAGRDADPRRGVARFKTAWAQTDKLSAEDLRLLSLAGEVGRVVGGLLTDMGKPPRLAEVRRLVPVTAANARPWEEGYHLAEEARRSMELGDGVLVALDATLQDWGVSVAEVEFTIEGVEAASIWEPRAAPVLLVNRRAPRCRLPLGRRAVLAHELCHLLHDAGEGDLCTLVSWAEDQGTYAQAVEQRARGFAPAFLAAPAALRAWCKREGIGTEDGKSVVARIAAHWGLSWEGAAYHAMNTRLLQQGEARELAHTP
ncbi:MAG: ImmA/IrrE family metallo-endopeptidase, partial [Deltaproteobacteria bacterium]|nr:ImmA/IrrE family metallo-endopeptidase [Deltaproteobacteria bacterium]